MYSHLSSLVRSGVVALTALASLSPAANAAPLGPVLDRATANPGGSQPLLIAMGEGRDRSNPAYQFWPRGGRGGHGGWNGRQAYDGGPGWRRGGWGGPNRGYWRRGWRGGGWNGGGWGGWGPGFALGLGLGVPLGYYGGGYYGGSGYYDPNYVPYRPRYYSPAGGSAHVQWCYARYRSYRVQDNSWQPNYGPRRQCISPYYR
jgi:BA14K-like protein